MVQETPAGQTILQSLLGDGLNGYGTPSIISPARPYYIFAGGGEKKGCVRAMSHQPSGTAWFQCARFPCKVQ